ncbi:MAG: response regulator [Bacteroidota bacterium]
MPYYQSVLLLDDDPLVNFVNNQWVKKHRLANNILLYEDPFQALAFIKANCLQLRSSQQLPDLLLLDIDMPGLNGFEFLDQLAQIPELAQKDARIFLLTSSNHPLDQKRAAQYPLTGYIVKPLEEQQIQQIIKASLV